MKLICINTQSRQTHQQTKAKKPEREQDKYLRGARAVVVRGGEGDGWSGLILIERLSVFCLHLILAEGVT